MAHARYARYITKLQRGDALWDPAPDVIRIGSQESGVRVRDPVVQVGHLGYIQDGKWRHILDIHRTHENQHRAGRIPSNLFEWMQRPDLSSQDRAGPNQLVVKRSGEISFRTTGDVGNSTAVTGPSFTLDLSHDASLFYHDCSQREQVLEPDVDIYKEYVVRNYDRWRTLSIPADKLGLVIDRTLTRSWITSVRTEKTASAQIGVDISVNGIATGGIALSFSGTSTEIEKNYGPFSRISILPTSLDTPIAGNLPSQDESVASSPLDQCIFVTLVKIADADRYRRLKALSILPRAALSSLTERFIRARRSPADEAQATSGSQGNQTTTSPALLGLEYLMYSHTSQDEASAPGISDDILDLFSEVVDVTDLSSVALWYILENSKVQRALFCDCDIYPYIEDITDDEGWLEVFARIRPRIYTYKYDDYTIGSLSELDFGTAVEMSDVAVPLEVLTKDISANSSTGLDAAPLPGADNNRFDGVTEDYMLMLNAHLRRIHQTEYLT